MPSSNVTIATAPALYNSFQLAAAAGGDGDLDEDDAHPVVDFAVQAALFGSLSPVQTVTPLHNCPTGNCKYPTFTTLAICGSCEAEEVQAECSGDYCLGEYAELRAYSWRDKSQHSTLLNQTLFASAENPETGYIAGTHTLITQNLTAWPPVYKGSECGLRWCLQEVKAKVVNATYHETTRALPAKATIASNGTAVFTYTDQTFSVTPSSISAFAALADSLRGWSKCDMQHMSWLHSSPLFAGLAKFITTSAAGSVPVSQIATAMSRALRTDSAISGHFVETRTVISVRWGWLAYPAAMWVLCAVFLAATMGKSARSRGRGLGYWGNSSLAVMGVGALEERLREWVMGGGERDGMEKRAGGVRARLVRDGGAEEGWRLIGART